MTGLGAGPGDATPYWSYLPTLIILLLDQDQLDYVMRGQCIYFNLLAVLGFDYAQIKLCKKRIVICILKAGTNSQSRIHNIHLIVNFGTESNGL